MCSFLHDSVYVISLRPGDARKSQHSVSAFTHIVAWHLLDTKPPFRLKLTHGQTDFETNFSGIWIIIHIDGLVQDCSIFSALEMEMQSCTKPSTYGEGVFYKNMHLWLSAVGKPFHPDSQMVLLINRVVTYVSISLCPKQNKSYPKATAVSKMSTMAKCERTIKLLAIGDTVVLMWRHFLQCYWLYAITSYPYVLVD